MEADTFDEREFFSAIAKSGARVLLIGRRAMVVYGLPVLTADYDLWLHIDDIEALNGALAPLGMFPNRTPEEARSHGRYVIENGEHVDVIVARGWHAAADPMLDFLVMWERRVTLSVHGVEVAVPTVDGLIAMKSFAARPKDLEDVRLLASLKADPS